MSAAPYEPTPEQIEAECLAIQAEWTAEERERRWQYPSDRHWLPPGAMKHRSPEDLWRAERGFAPTATGGGNYDREDGWERLEFGD